MYQEKSRAKNNGNGKMAAGIAAGVAVIVIAVIAVVVMMNRPKTINLEDYVRITCSGYDGYAEASVTLDKSGLRSDIMDLLGRKPADSMSELREEMQFDEKVSDVLSGIELEITSSRKNLSNGDVVKVNISYNNSAAKKIKIRFSGKTVSETVEDLEPIEEIDPFEDFEVSFTGISPFGKMSCKYNGGSERINTYSFKADKRDDLKNGDVVTFTIDADDAETMKKGYVIVRKEEQYTVSGLDEYLTAYSDLSEDDKNVMKSDAEDIIFSYVAGNYNGGSALSGLTYAGYILDSRKEPDGYWYSTNELYLIYEGTVSNSEGRFRTSQVYFPVQFTDVVKTADGCSYNANHGISGRCSIDGSSYYTNGYVNPLECYIDLVTENSDAYDAECGDGFEQYAEYERIDEVDDISESFTEELYKDARPLLDDQLEREFNEDASVGNIREAGQYLLLNKEQGADFGSANRYFLVFAVDVSSRKDAFEPLTVYYVAEYDGIVKLPGDEYIALSRKGIRTENGYSMIPNQHTYSIWGYVSGEDMYAQVITRNRDRYTYDVSEELKQFGE